ncbi:MAG: metallophosphoesterase [Firmicutes bacterium]|nr:metallophosphoesterase [Bacillota bacterium]
MKKITVVLLFLLVLTLSSCQESSRIIEYSDDEPFVIEMRNDTLQILQLTDLHLTYGIDANDRKTFATIEKLVKSTDFDLIVITGDMTMSTAGPTLFSKLINRMEALETPWTFVFGNHEIEFHDYFDFLNLIKDTEYLYFKVGPELSNGGYGNFRITFTKDDADFYNLYFMDSHASREEYTEDEGEYDYIQSSQVQWYSTHVENDVVDSMMFMHIPLRQFIDAEDYVGLFNEDKVYAQGVDTGLFDALVLANRTKGVFVGHDHLNDFYFFSSGIYLAYGRVSGYNAYGNLERGGRVIEVNENSEMSTYILLESEVSS